MDNKAVKEMVIEQDRNFWKEKAEIQQARAVVYKTVFAISAGFNIAWWIL